MQSTTLGGTGLTVSVAGLGGGGKSRLGQSQGVSTEHSVGIVQAAIDLGVTFIDTAPTYRTETIVGRAIAGRRDQVVLSTKSPFLKENVDLTAAELIRGLEASLAALGTDRIDIYHLHGVPPDSYAYCRDALVPALLRAREQGKIGHLGITERFGQDTKHRMLDAALDDDFWEVVMIGFSMLNPSARASILTRSRAKDLGVLDMFAVRRVLSQPGALAKFARQAVRDGVVSGDALDLDAPLDFLISEGGAESVVDAAYRFCRHEPGIHVVLFGTGSREHLEANIASINRGPLNGPALRRLEELFGAVDTVSGN
ncbi:MAG TPA: aldo/keto reductase [Alphaproteobacteria bacterium]|nr:aldo/keto reductase [Alphaproteobacteria bacterium]